MKHIFYPVWQRILIEFDQTETAYELSERIHVTYPHVYNTIKRLKKARIIRIQKFGRKNALSLTSKGRKIRYALMETYRLEKGD